MNPDLVAELQAARLRYYNKMRTTQDPEVFRFWRRHAQQCEIALRGEL